MSRSCALCLLCAAILLGLAAPRASGDPAVQDAGPELIARAVLPADSFAAGPTSGRQLGPDPINGRTPPFAGAQPVQGFSAVLATGPGKFLAMSDNGFGQLENSADFRLRVQRIRPRFETRRGGPGTIDVDGFLELRDPDRRIPFAITEFFSAGRALTGADFDIESMQMAGDGTLWFGDEFGPFLLHTSASGKVLEPPVRLPDFELGGELRAPQNPFSEESSAVRLMNAVRQHARLHGSERVPVVSPDQLLLADGNPASFVDSREAPPPGSGLAAASSEIFDVGSLHRAGYLVVPYTVDERPRMDELLALGVDGMISDRPDLLFAAVAAFDANHDGTPGDWITPEGLIDARRFDAQGHRGARDLRPENTLPAMEAALDALATTLETDTGLTSDLVPVLDHDPFVSSAKCRLASGAPYAPDDEILVKDLSAAALQQRFICDRLIRGPEQKNDRSLSPVSAAFALRSGLRDPYVVPTLQQLFEFADFYRAYHESGAGRSAPGAARRARNAARVRFNVETKLNPRREFRDRTFGPELFVWAVAGTIARNRLESRADVQSFDFRTLLGVQERFPKIRAVCLFGDFPVFANPDLAGSDDGTNLQGENGQSSPWLAGLPWPYRVTARAQPFRAQTSGGFEGMAISPDRRRLLPLLERPLAGDDPGSLLIHEYDLVRRRYTGVRYRYPLDPRGTNIGDFVLFDRDQGLVIERDGSQGTLDGFKAIFAIQLPRAAGEAVAKQPLVNLLHIRDPAGISLPAAPGDVGLGARFAFPFTTIEDVIVLGPREIGVLNDNNYPFSVGRHVGSGEPDDDEFIVLQLPRPLATATSLRDSAGALEPPASGN